MCQNIDDFSSPLSYYKYKIKLGKNIRFSKIFTYSKGIEMQKICSNCSTRTTTIWRKNFNKNAYLCNPCGIYERVHKKSRPFVCDENGSVRVKRKSELHGNCLFCDSVSEKSHMENKAFCKKCSPFLRHKDYNMFKSFSFNVNKKFIMKKSKGIFYEFNIFDDENK